MIKKKKYIFREGTLKGLRALSQIARDTPEQLDACAPGLLARVLGKHVKNLRSQVARVACSATGEVFAAHVRGIDQVTNIQFSSIFKWSNTSRYNSLRGMFQIDLRKIILIFFICTGSGWNRRTVAAQNRRYQQVPSRRLQRGSGQHDRAFPTESHDHDYS